MSTPILPFVWTNSVSIINSHMISLDIRNYITQTELEIWTGGLEDKERERPSKNVQRKSRVLQNTGA